MRGYTIFLGLFIAALATGGAVVTLTSAQEGQGSEPLPLVGSMQQPQPVSSENDISKESVEMEDFGHGSMFVNAQNAEPMNDDTRAEAFGASSSAAPRTLYRPYNRDRSCRINSLLNDVDERYLFCGDDGWSFPILWSGDCPISACILDMQSDQQPLGSIFTDK
jgi:hypothetical protein